MFGRGNSHADRLAPVVPFTPPLCGAVSITSVARDAIHGRQLGSGKRKTQGLRDKTTSGVRIVNGIKKYVTETSEEIPVASVGDRATGKPVAKAGPRPTPTLTLSPVSIPYNERNG